MVVDLVRSLFPRRLSFGGLYDLVAIVLAPIVVVALIMGESATEVLALTFRWAGLDAGGSALEATGEWFRDVLATPALFLLLVVVAVVAVLVTAKHGPSTRAPFTLWLALAVATEVGAGLTVALVGLGVIGLVVLVKNARRMGIETRWSAHLHDPTGEDGMELVGLIMCVPLLAVLAVVSFLFGATRPRT